MASRRSNHPLPSPPSSGNRNRGISFGGKSDRSHRSKDSAGKISLHETPQEKARRSLHTKADPTLAMNEAQPATVAAYEKSNLGSLRSIQHKDQYGNLIVDPDLSNPTRPRFERPLDTIRSFEAAIDGSYNNRRMSYITEGGGAQSRPTSYYGNNGGGEYGRPPMSRPDSFVDYGASGSNGYNGQYPNNQYGQPQSRGNNRARYSNNRSNADYANGGGYNQQQNFYPNAAYQQSNDNVTAGSGSANIDQWGNSTDPSSVNSSFDRLQQQAQKQQRQPAESYGYSSNPQIDNYNNYPQQQDGPPPPPPHRQSYQMNGANAQSSYNNGYNGGAAVSSQPFNPPLPGPPKKLVVEDKKKKRGSWLQRRFSKNN